MCQCDRIVVRLFGYASPWHAIARLGQQWVFSQALMHKLTGLHWVWLPCASAACHHMPVAADVHHPLLVILEGV